MNCILHPCKFYLLLDNRYSIISLCAWWIFNTGSHPCVVYGQLSISTRPKVWLNDHSLTDFDTQNLEMLLHKKLRDQLCLWHIANLITRDSTSSVTRLTSHHWNFSTVERSSSYYRVATKILRKFFGVTVQNLKVGNLYQSSTTLGLDQVSSSQPQTKKLH